MPVSPAPRLGAPRLSTIPARATFVRMNQHASRFVVSGFIVQMLADEALGAQTIGVGYTATKKLGGAVVRNRARRRLREAARQVLPRLGKASHHYVFIARHGLLECTFDTLLREMEFAISRIKAK